MNKTNTKICAVIIARNGSSRLPNKALANICGKTILELISERISHSNQIQKIIIATSTNKEDDQIEFEANKLGINCFRGDPEDVLKRLYDSVQSEDIDAVVEIGGDCPLISGTFLDEGINIYHENPDADVVSNALLPPYTYPDGFDFILLTKKCLEILNKNAKLDSERKQPFQYILKNQNQFKIVSFKADNNFNKWRWTLDYPEDLKFISAVYSDLYNKNKRFDFNDIKKLIEDKPDIVKLNSMHAHETVINSAWFTGSYVDEMHEDIQYLLKKAKNLDKDSKFNNAKKIYSQISLLVNELSERAKTRINDEKIS
ncbi:MAG: acylneuraminate cytidylyltransferase [Crocinitomicaceae bacterium]|jgi:spore coat polysaccharide biosynthesis protein SpsF|nr:acylneuraminate cytidylyltransferase [Crocinitomicaceae bacterium]|tara:strand:- start:4107 stop:5051 length:945 start_codon:yes stop_codon:yes gene_type:complete